MLRGSHNTGFSLLELIISIAVLGIITAGITLQILRDSRYETAVIMARDLNLIISSAANRIVIHDEFIIARLLFSANADGEMAFTVRRNAGGSEHLDWLKYDDCTSGMDAINISLKNSLNNQQYSLVLPCYILGDLGSHIQFEDTAFVVIDNTSTGSGFGYSLQININLGESSVFGSSGGGAYFAKFYQELVKLLILNEVLANETDLIVNEVDNSGNVLAILNNHTNDALERGEFLRNSVEGTSSLQIIISNVYDARALLSDGSVNLQDSASLCWESHASGSVNCFTNTETGLSAVDESGVKVTLEASSLISNDHQNSPGYTTPRVHFIRAGEKAIQKPQCPDNFEAQIATAISSFGDGGGQDVSGDWGDTTDGGGVNYDPSSLIGIVATGWNSNQTDDNYWDVHSLMASELESKSDSPNVSLIAFTWCDRL